MLKIKIWLLFLQIKPDKLSQKLACLSEILKPRRDKDVNYLGKRRDSKPFEEKC